MNDSLPSLSSFSGPDHTKALEARVEEYKSTIEATQFERLYSLYKAAELHSSSAPRSTSSGNMLTPMSSAQSSFSSVVVDQATPSRKRPLLPPINPAALPRQEIKFPSPISAAPSLSEARSSNLHGLLNHADSLERSHSASPASSAGPETPVTTLPPVNTLTAHHPSAGYMDNRKTQFFGGMPSPTKSSFPSLPRFNMQTDRRMSDASLFSGTSPSTSMTSSFGHRQSSPPAPPPNTIHSAYQTHNGNFQFMTASGLVVPLDTHQASRIADEKRKRNAGASARFRQRRKEKEKESVSAISRLETKVKELEDMNVWYRTERDRLRQVCVSHGLQAQVGPRPASPVLSKSVSSESMVSTPSEWQQQGDRGSEQARNQRRRMDYFEAAQASSQGQHSSTHNVHESMSFATPRVFTSHTLAGPGAGRHHYEHQHDRQYVTAR